MVWGTGIRRQSEVSPDLEPAPIPSSAGVGFHAAVDCVTGSKRKTTPHRHDVGSLAKLYTLTR